MGIVFRQSVKTTIVTFTGVFLGALTILAYTFILSPHDYGFLRNLFNQGAVLQLVATFGAAGTLNSFIMRYPAGKERMTIFFLNFLIPAGMMLLMFIPYSIWRTDIVHLYKPQDWHLVDTYYYCMPLLILLWTYMTLFEAYLNGQHKTAISVFMREVVLRLLNLLIIGLFYLKVISFSVFVVSSIAIYAVPSVLMIFIAMKTEGFRFTWDLKSLSRKDYTEMLRFSWYHLLVGVSIVAIQYIDGNMLGLLSPQGVASVSVYANAVFIASVITVPYRAMAAATLPSLNMAYINEDHHHLQDSFNRSALNAFIVSVAMVVLVGCNLGSITSIFPASYKMMAPVVAILLIGRIADMSTGFNTEVIYVSKYYRFNFRISLLLLGSIILGCYLLIPSFDAYGAAWATSAGLFIFNVGKTIFVWKKMNLQPFSRNTGLAAIAGLAAAVAGYFFPDVNNPFADILIRSCVIMIVYGGLLLWLKPSKDIVTYLQSVRKNKKLF